MTIDVLDGDHQGGPRVNTRFGLLPRGDGARLPSAGRHQNIDRPDPR